MWELDYKESWMLKNWCFWTVMLEKTLESPLDYKEIQSVNPKGNSPEYSLEGLVLKLKPNTLATWCKRTDSLEKTLMLGKIEGMRRRGRLKAREGDGREWDGCMSSPSWWTWVWASSGSWWWTVNLVCCCPRGCKESDTTEQLDWTGWLKQQKFISHGSGGWEV